MTTVGMDAVTVADVRDALARFGERYTARMFTPLEMHESRARPAALAHRVAVKEAVMKLLSPSRPDTLPWTSIEVRADTPGTFTVALTGDATRLAGTARVGTVHASSSLAGGLAVAVATAEEAR